MHDFFQVGGDDKNSSLHIIQLDQGGLSLPTRDYYLSLNDTTNKEVIEAFTDMIAELAKLLIMDNEGINQVQAARLTIFSSLQTCDGFCSCCSRFPRLGRTPFASRRRALSLLRQSLPTLPSRERKDATSRSFTTT